MKLNSPKRGADGAAIPMHETTVLRTLSPERLNVPGIRAGFSFRHGGVSPQPYHTLNVGLSTGDEAANVAENRRRLFEKVGLSHQRLAIAGQVHGNEVRRVSEPDLYPGYDALVSNTKDLVLCITSADCAVVLLRDVDARVVGACHSGWRGTVEEVAVHTVNAMEQLGARADRMHAFISPCISTDHFEVGPEVAARFDARYVIERADWARPHVDLKGIIGEQLVHCGLFGASIEISPRCTFSETHDFFSYRAENGTTGRMMGYISIV